jgi:CysZ protein
MYRALSLSFQSLSDPRVLRVLAKSVALTMVIFAILGVGLWTAIDRLMTHFGYGDDIVSALAAAAVLILCGALLFRIIAIAVLWMFSDSIVDAVEDRYYPDHAVRGKKPTVPQSAAMAMRSVLRALSYNLLALPVYIVLLLTGVGTAIAFLGVNALLLGRDLEDMLIARHGTDHGTLGRASRLMIGLIGTSAMLIPFVNLLVPVVATAMAVHMVHGQGKGLS